MRWLIAAAVAVLLAVALSGKIVLLVAAIFGVALVVAVVRWPLVGVIGIVFAGTSLQVLGSEFATGLPLSLSRIFGLLTFVALGLRLFTTREKLTFAPAMKPLLWFLAVVALGVVIQPDTKSSLEGLLKMVQVATVYLLIANIAIDRRSLRWICIAVTATVVLASFIAMAEHFLPSLQLSATDPRLAHGTLGAVVDEDSADSGDIARVSGGVGDANYFAYTVAAAFPLTLYWWRQAKRPPMKALVLVVAAIQGIGLTFSYTRTGFLGLAVATVYLAIRRRLPIVPLVLLGLLAAGIATVYMPPAFLERMTSSRYLEEGSTPFRRDLLLGAWRLVNEKPLLGYGYGQFGPQFLKLRQAGDSAEVMEEMIDIGYEDVHDLRCHNTYLEIALEFGVIGLIPFCWFLWRLLTDLKDAERATIGTDDAELAIVITAGLVGFYTCAILAHSKVVTILWILAGLSAAARRVAIEARDVHRGDAESAEEMRERVAHD